MTKKNLEEDEKLAMEVEKYPCLYDKADPRYKNLDRKVNAWNSVDDALGYERGLACRHFEVLKKRYSRKRNDFKNASWSGSVTKDYTWAKKELDEYAFMSWLDKYIRPKKTKSCAQAVVEAKNDDDCNDNILLKGGSEEFSKDDQENSIASSPKIAKIEQIRTSKIVPASQSTPSDPVPVAMRSAATSFEHHITTHVEENGEDEVYGKLITLKLKAFPDDVKFRVKHDIDEVIYAYQLRLMERSACYLSTSSITSPQFYSTPPFSPSYISRPLISPPQYITSYNEGDSSSGVNSGIPNHKNSTAESKKL